MEKEQTVPKKEPSSGKKEDDSAAPLPLTEKEIETLATMVWLFYASRFHVFQGPYAKAIKEREEEIQDLFKKVRTMTGLKESDTGSGLAPPTLWDLNADKQRLQQEQPLSVARCTTIIPPSGTTNEEHARPGEGSGPATAAAKPAAAPAKPAAVPLGGLLAGRLPGAPDAPLSDEGQTKYVISIHQMGKFVVGLGENVAPTGLPPALLESFIYDVIPRRCRRGDACWVCPVWRELIVLRSDVIVRSLLFSFLFLQKLIHTSP